MDTYLGYLFGDWKYGPEVMRKAFGAYFKLVLFDKLGRIIYYLDY